MMSSRRCRRRRRSSGGRGGIARPRGDRRQGRPSRRRTAAALTASLGRPALVSHDGRARHRALTRDRPRPLLVLDGVDDLLRVVARVGVDARGVRPRFARRERRRWTRDEPQEGAFRGERVMEDDKARRVVAPFQFEGRRARGARGGWCRVDIALDEVDQVFGFEGGAELGQEEDPGRVDGVDLGSERRRRRLKLRDARQARRRPVPGVTRDGHVRREGGHAVV